jgi:NTE family protein
MAGSSFSPTLRAWLDAGPFTLVMSSGFFAFYAHTGMLDALLETGRAPEGVAGSSAGALVGGAWAAGLPPDALAATLTALARDDFWDPGLGFGLLAGRKFDALLRRILPVATLEACRVPIAISVFDIARRATVALTRGDLALAIRASCCVPVMFHPVRIAGRAYWDGGIRDRPGLAGVPAPARVLYHHISSRSPWRRERDLAIPARAGMVTLVIEDLPRSGPFKLAEGRAALARATLATRVALAAPIPSDGVIRI